MNEKRLFSDLVKNSKSFYPSLLKSSMSEDDAQHRMKAYEKMFANYAELKHLSKSFSSYAENVNLSNQYFDATVLGLTKSFAGYTAIERSVDAATALLYFLDIMQVSDSARVLSNVGVDTIGNYRNKVLMDQTTVTATDIYNFAPGAKLIPGTVKLVVTIDGVAYDIIDNKLGVLIAPPDKITAGTVNYSTGAVSVTLKTGVVDNDDTIRLTAIKDLTGIQSANRFRTQLEHIEVTTYPELLVAEHDLVSLAGMQRTLNINMVDYLTGRLTDLYTKILNKNIVSEIADNYSGTTTVIELTNAVTAFQDYRSQLDKFSAELSDVDSDLAEKSYKGTKATTYLVGKDVAAMFRKLKNIGLFREEPSSYVNDLVGYYGDIPVLEHLDIADEDGYAVHKTVDGNMAPVARALFLPLTNTPQVGNYDNPTQQATGVFYQDKTQHIAGALVQKFNINVDA